MASDGENIARERCLSFGIIEMDDRAVVLDQVDFLNAGNIIYCELLQSRLQFLVVGCGCLVDNLLLATWSTCNGSRSLLVSPRVLTYSFNFAKFDIDFGFSHFSPRLWVVPPQCPTFSTDADKLSLSLQLLQLLRIHFTRISWFFWRSRAFKVSRENEKGVREVAGLERCVFTVNTAEAEINSLKFRGRQHLVT